MGDNTPLSDRMERYEHTYRVFLPRRTYVLMRLDGRAFHSYLRHAVKPFDRPFMEHMDLVAEKLVAEIQGAQFAYTQSDEISILITDFEDITTEPWFGGNVAKLQSVSASLAASYLSQLRYFHGGLPHFDCRVWTMSDPVEVANYFVWRQRDAVRNSIQMVGQTYFSHTELDGKSTDEVQEMLWQKHRINWSDRDPREKRGRLLSWVEDEGWVTLAAPTFQAAPGSTLARLIPPLPSLHDGGPS